MFALHAFCIRTKSSLLLESSLFWEKRNFDINWELLRPKKVEKWRYLKIFWWNSTWSLVKGQRRAASCVTVEENDETITWKRYFSLHCLPPPIETFVLCIVLIITDVIILRMSHNCSEGWTPIKYCMDRPSCLWRYVLKLCKKNENKANTEGPVINSKNKGYL